MSVDQVTTVYRGRVIVVGIETVTLPNGHRVELEIVRVAGGAAAVALDENERVCLLRQYRHAAGGYIWELPAGKLEPPEPPLSTARRELIEEAGVAASEWHSLGVSVSSPGVLVETIHLFLATDLVPARAAPEAAEVLEVHWVPLEEACRRVVEGEIDDSKTAVGLLRAWHMRHGFVTRSAEPSASGP